MLQSVLNELANLHKLCFPHKPWGADDFADLKKSGCEIIASQNGFIVYRKTLDEAEIISIGVAPDARRTGIGIALIGMVVIVGLICRVVRIVLVCIVIKL